MRGKRGEIMYQLREKNGHLEYQDQNLGMTFPVPAECKADLLFTPDVEAIRSEADVEDAVKHPQYGEPLKKIVEEKQAKTACILVSDATRAVPTARLVKYVIQELAEAGISYENIHAFVAIGVHRDATEKEMQDFLGEFYGKIQIENHMPYDKEKLVYLGETSRHTPVWVNKKAYECDVHIQIGKVEPHEFAGFSGGRKSVLPGISAEDTIVINHRPEMILQEKATIGVLEGNPVHEDMEEAAEKFRMDFGVNCILNNQLELSAVFAGEMKKSHQAAISWVKESLGVSLQRPDIIVTTPGNPLDIDFYQTVKALIALTEVVNENTVVILYCGCPEGVNSPDMLRAFQSSRDLEEVVSYTTENYKIQMDHVLLLSKILKKHVKIIVHCPNISDQEITGMFMYPAHTPQEAIEQAIQACGKKDAEILFYPRPQTGLPIVR